MIYKHLILASSFLLSVDLEKNFQDRVLREVKSALNSTEVMASLNIFELLQVYNNQVYNTTNVNFDEFYSAPANKLFFAPGYLIAENVKIYAGLKKKPYSYISTSSSNPINTPTAFYTPNISQLTDHFNIEYIGANDQTYANLGYTNTQYIKYVSAGYCPSVIHEDIYKNDTAMVSPYIKPTNTSFVKTNAGRTADNLYTRFITIKFRENAGILSNVTFSFVYDQTDKRYYGFTDLDARIIWNLAYETQSANIDADPNTNNNTFNPSHIKALRDNDYYYKYPRFNESNKPIVSQILNNLSGDIPNIFLQCKLLINTNVLNDHKFLNIEEPFFNTSINTTPNFALPIKIGADLKDPKDLSTIS